MKYIIASGILLVIIFYGCGDTSINPPNNNNQNQNSNYTLFFTAENSTTSFRVFSASANRFVYGYNDLGIKVLVNGVEKTTGWITFIPKMYHNFPNSPWHSSPTSPQFTYDGTKSMFMGYACFTMFSDTSMTWYAFFNYNNEASVDSSSFWVDSYSSAQVKAFTSPLGGIYYLTLAAPYIPAIGMNPFKCLLHRSENLDHSFTEITNASMIIRPWMGSMGHGSSGNVNPSFTSNGIYEGQANFTMSGTWTVYDTIRIGTDVITPTESPYFTFNP